MCLSCLLYTSNNGLSQLSNIPAKVTDLAKALETVKNEAVLYYKNGGNNADKDSLFLIDVYKRQVRCFYPYVYA